MQARTPPVATVFLLLLLLAPPAPRAAPAPLAADELQELAVDAYVYAYPMVLMEVTRRVMTNGGEGAPAGNRRRPVNQFHHAVAFPDASFTAVVRPNADTLFSLLWFDVGEEPLVIDVPDSGGRYYLLPVLDMWTDVFASPGKRTTGTGAQSFALTGPRWEGKLPEGVDEIRAPTAQGWLLGRTQTNGKADYEAVHRFQAGLRAAPLSHWKKPYAPPAGRFDPTRDMRPPVEQVEGMDARTFFATFAGLLHDNPPHANDQPILARLARIGLVPGRPFDLAAATPEVQDALGRAGAAAMARIEAYERRADPIVQGWALMGNPAGSYGTDYLKRALVAWTGLGANTLEDAAYAFGLGEPDGTPFDGASRYVLHFDAGELPPVRAFWSVTLYDERKLFAANPIDRYVLGDRDALARNPDGSIDILIQHDPPGPGRESNWLPAPAQGRFDLLMRLYWPKASALDGSWTPPPVERTD